MDDKNKDPLEIPDGAEEVFDTLDGIVGTQDTQYKSLKAWGGKAVRIGSLTAGQVMTFLANNDDPSKKRRNGTMLIALSLVNKEGKRLVNPKDNTEIDKAIDQLIEKDAGINGALVERILVFNGLRKAEAKTIAKNVSGEANSGVSPSDSVSS